MHFFFFEKISDVSPKPNTAPACDSGTQEAEAGAFPVNSRSTLATHLVPSPPGFCITLSKPTRCSIDACSSKPRRKRAASTVTLPCSLWDWLFSAHVFSTFSSL